MSSPIIARSDEDDKEANMILYLSGPISGDPDYREKFAAKEAELKRDLLCDVINPAKLADTFPGFTDSKYFSIALVMMSYCDAVYMLDGWQDSTGAQIERMAAKRMGKRVMYQCRHGNPDQLCDAIRVGVEKALGGQQHEGA